MEERNTADIGTHSGGAISPKTDIAVSEPRQEESLLPAGGIAVSVIVPVYNSAPYLRRCMDSICGQTLREIEIICVDDGSTDESPEILREYQQKDNRIRVYRQQNLYAGAARNTGKKHAAGEYLIFWDSDDFYDLTALEKMYRRAKEDRADICICGANQYFEQKGVTAPNKVYLNRKNLPEQMPFSRATWPDYILNFTNEAPWNKMFRRAFVEETGLDFQAVRNGNDIFFVASHICLAERITIVDEPLVTYRIDIDSSLMGTLTKSPLTPLKARIAVREVLTGRDALPEQSFFNKTLGSVIYLLRNAAPSFEAFSTAVDFLRSEGLERLGISEREPEYYYSAWHAEALHHLLYDTTEDFMGYLLRQTYLQMTMANAKRQIDAGKFAVRRAEWKDTRKALQKDLRQQEKQTASLEKQKARLEKAEEKLARERDSLAEKVGALEKQAEERAGQLERLRSETAALREEMRKKEEQYSRDRKEVKRLAGELEKTRASWSFRIGQILMWLPGKLKRLFGGR